MNCFILVRRWIHSSIQQNQFVVYPKVMYVQWIYIWMICWRKKTLHKKYIRICPRFKLAKSHAKNENLILVLSIRSRISGISYNVRHFFRLIDKEISEITEYLYRVSRVLYSKDKIPIRNDIKVELNTKGKLM